MGFLAQGLSMHFFQRKFAYFRRFWLLLNHASASAWACFLVPVAGGLFSLLLGQDTNWDLQNYHLYNAYAWLNGRIGFDLAPAQMQTYFNPLLDIPYFEMATHWPARLVGFTMGAFQALVFLPLLGVVRLSLAQAPEEGRNRLAILLSLAGCVSAGFLAELGNTMGDNATALLVVTALFALLYNGRRLGGSFGGVVAVVFAGLLVGLAAGLKLTNAVYAVALCLACLALPLAWPARLGVAFWVGVGVLLGFSISAGFWHWGLWQRFGNPLFPQFNSIFNSPLASAIWIVDVRWLPKGWGEALLWPFIFTLNPQRVGEIPAWQIGWPALYVLFAAWALAALRAKVYCPQDAESAGRSRFLLAFIALGYLIWLKLFSVYRYLVPLELLAPLAIWLLLHRILEARRARQLGGWVLALGVAVVLSGLHTWDHKSWGQTAFRVDTPDLASPDKTTIVFAGGSPMAWMAPFFPKSVAFASVLGTFPEGPAYAGRLRSMLAERAGPVYLIVEGKSHFRLNAVVKMNALFDDWGLTRRQASCRALRWALGVLHVRAAVQAPGRDGASCGLGLLPQDGRDIAAENQALATEKSAILQRYGLQVAPGPCEEYSAFIGDHRMPYQWCRVQYAPAPALGR